MRNSFKLLIAEEVESAIKSTRDWVEDKMSDAATLLTVPNVIGDRDEKGFLKVCPYKTFPDFVNTMTQRSRTATKGITDFKAKLVKVQEEIGQIPLIEERICQYFKDEQGDIEEKNDDKIREVQKKVESLIELRLDLQNRQSFNDKILAKEEREKAAKELTEKLQAQNNVGQKPLNDKILIIQAIVDKLPAELANMEAHISSKTNAMMTNLFAGQDVTSSKHKKDKKKKVRKQETLKSESD